MKTNVGLVEYCKAQLGKPYWYGTYGDKACESLLRRKSVQYPNYYKDSDFVKQYGQRVHDCAGLIKGYLWSETPTSTPIYDKNQDVGNLYNYCSEVGELTTIPELPGVLVFMKGHVGVYIGKGKVIEARGHAYGVVQTNLVGRGWTSWGKLKWIAYEEGVKEMTEEDYKKIIKEKAELSDKTIEFLSNYLYHEDLFRKLAVAIQK